MRHRAEIDGLRAIAVLPVIFFHAGFNAFHGGFIGVDVFFVISGYLITSLIDEDRQRARFSIAEFYERRARRILPALFFVLTCCLLAAWWVMNSSDFISFGRSLAAVSVFSSGLLYIFTAGYFDPSSDLNPLLHTWSLGVEEQYYMLFPPIFMLLARLGSMKLRIGLLVLTIASLAYAQWGITTYPTATFYFMPTRAWELLIGALLALSQARLNQCPPWLSQAMSALGMGLLLTAAALFDDTTPAPSIYILVPTLGAALIIGFGNASTWVGRLLSARALVSIGLISYSAYLWHQPLFAFTRLAYDREPGAIVMFSMAMASLVLAYGTWRWVETPFRSRQQLSRGWIFALSGGFTLGFIGIGGAASYHVLSTRWEQHNPRLVNFSSAANLPVRSNCRYLLRDVGGLGDCIQIGEGRRTMVVWGDSHAKALQGSDPGLPDTRILLITHSGCAPLPGLRRFDDSDSAHACKDFKVLNDFARVIESLHPDTVVLASRWNNYLRGCVFEGRTLARQHFMMSDGHDDKVLASLTYREDIFGRQLQAIVDRLSMHSQVLILTQPMDLAQRTFREVEASDLTVSRAEVDEWHAPEQAMFSQLKLPPNAQIVDVKRLFCNEQGCATRLKGTLLYRDDNHLSPFCIKHVWQALSDSSAGVVRSAQTAHTMQRR
jgi:peptidoglycan/LPS O-acetylase OafA/YrhL